MPSEPSESLRGRPVPVSGASGRSAVPEPSAAPLSLDAWLAQMPVAAMQARIAEIEGELAFLQSLRAMRAPVVVRLAPRETSNSYRGRILTLLRERPGLGPRAIRRELGLADVSENAVQTTLSRMVRAKQVERVGYGSYRVL